MANKREEPTIETHTITEESIESKKQAGVLSKKGRTFKHKSEDAILKSLKDLA